MKSAYELAMERLERESGPTKKLTDEQKTQIAEIEKRYEAKMAEHRLASEAKLRGAANAEEYEKAQAELAQGLADLEAKRDDEKNAVWNSA